MALPSFQDIKNTFVARWNAEAQAINPSADLTTGNVLVDLARDTNIALLAQNYFIADYLSRIQTPSGFLSVLADSAYLNNLATGLGISTTGFKYFTQSDFPSTVLSDMDARLFTDVNTYAALFNITRLDPVKQVFQQKFVVDTGAVITIPLGTEVSNANGSVRYKTITSITDNVPGFDSVTQQHYVVELVEASEAGADTTGLNVLIRLASSVPRVLSTTNFNLVVAGTDTESNSSVLNRIAEKLFGRNINTEQGYRNLVLDGGFGITDAVVLGAADSERGPGAVDIWVVGARVTSTSETVTPSEAFRFQPVKTCPTGLVRDTGVNRRSVYGYDLPSGLMPLIKSYTYYIGISELQSYLLQEENNVIAANVQVKAAIEAVIDIYYDFVVMPGYILADVVAAVEENLVAYLNGGVIDGVSHDQFGLGAPVTWSELERVILDTPGVYYVSASSAQGFTVYAAEKAPSVTPSALGQHWHYNSGTSLWEWADGAPTPTPPSAGGDLSTSTLPLDSYRYMYARFGSFTHS